MFRAIGFLVLLAGAVALALWTADNPGSATFAWGGWVIATPLWVLVLTVLGLMLVAALGYRFWRGILRAPGAFARNRRQVRRQKGYEALTKGLVAVAAGDPDGAQRYASRAEVLLNDPPVTLLLSAQAAQLRGDEKAAERFFRQMIARPDTEFLGVRGLLTQAMKADQVAEALELVRRAHKLQPTTPWVLQTRFDLEARTGHWAEAQQVLAQAGRARVIPQPQAKRHRAALLAEQSAVLQREGRIDDAVSAAQQAHDLDPASAPFSIHLARLLVRTGKGSYGQRAIEQTWKTAPHPALVHAYAELFAATPDKLERVRRLQRLASMAPRAPEGHVAVAGAALEAKLYSEARRRLMQVVDRAPDGRGARQAFLLLSELEEAEHGDLEKARRWRTKAAEAPPEMRWTCGACGNGTDDWHALCPHCGSFDTITWRQPVPAYLLEEPGASSSRANGAITGTGNAVVPAHAMGPNGHAALPHRTSSRPGA